MFRFWLGVMHRLCCIVLYGCCMHLVVGLRVVDFAFGVAYGVAVMFAVCTCVLRIV